MLLSERASFPLAHAMAAGEATLGDVFSFLSGLYFRGKLAYARAFARPPRRVADATGGGVLLITPGEGLCVPESPATSDRLKRFARVDVSASNLAYRLPLEAGMRALVSGIGPRCQIVLLGSIATPKYIDVLRDIAGARLYFPADFVGRGDMSRGGLLLRCVREGRELPYVPVAGAVRHGPRPPRLAPLPKVAFHAD